MILYDRFVCKLFYMMKLQNIDLWLFENENEFIINEYMYNFIFAYLQNIYVK